MAPEVPGAASAAAPVGDRRNRARRFPLGAKLTMAELADDPHPLFHRLRAAEPVTWAPALDMWLVTRREDVAQVLADWRTFTTDSPKSTIRDIFGSHMLTTDGADQTRYKRRFVGPFRRGRLERTLMGAVSGVLDELMADLAATEPDARGRGRADLRRRVARPLSVRSICRVIGLPAADSGRLAAWYEVFARALENFAGDAGVRDAGRAAAREFAAYAAPFLDGERRVPDGSMIAALKGDAGDGLAREEIVANLLIVLFGGIETTESMIGNALWAALIHPAVAERMTKACRGGRARSRVRAGDRRHGGDRGGAAGGDPGYPSFVSRVVEESMRWEPAVQSCTRFATRETRLRGVRIARGETVQCMLGAANRDPCHFPDPDRFDPDRPNSRDHLAFGAGRHFCLGASLARIEAEQSLRRVFAELPGLRVDADRAARPHGHEFRAPPTIWVTWDRARHDRWTLQPETIE